MRLPLLVALPLLLCACGRFGFGVPAASPAADAGQDLRADAVAALDAPPLDAGGADAAPLSCATLAEGAPCDDGNICTAESSCRGGVCTPSAPAPAEGCTVADSRAEFSGTQGASGWWYGYWHAEVDADGAFDPATDFIAMVYRPQGQSWHPPDDSEDPADPGYTWCYLAPYWEHPGGPPWPRKVPVRRWISDVSGPALAAIHFLMQDDGGGDGVTKSLRVDGELVWSHHVDGSDGTPVDVEVPIALRVGARVDFLLDAETNDAQDTTEFWVAIRSP